MNSSNELHHNLARTTGSSGDPGFSMIVAFDYYDGPEHGLALYPSGEGVRFSSLGDSKSRLFRAFEFIPIEGDWWPQVRALQQSAGIDPARKMMVPAEHCEMLTRLQSDVLQAPGMGLFVGVGSPVLDQISICRVTSEQIDRLRELGCSPEGFELAHRLVKSRNAGH